MGTLLKKLAEKGMLSAMDAEGIEKILVADAEWDENKHPRGKGGKFTKKGSGSASGGSEKEKKKEGAEGGAKAEKTAKKASSAKKSGGYNLNTTDPKEKKKIEKLAREYGYKDLDQMKRLSS